MGWPDKSMVIVPEASSFATEFELEPKKTVRTTKLVQAMNRKACVNAWIPQFEVATPPCLFSGVKMRDGSDIGEFPLFSQ